MAEVLLGNIKGESGATVTPSVSSAGNLSWTNDKGLPNPPTVNIRGPQGPAGNGGSGGESIDTTLFLTKEEYAEGFDGGEL